MMTTWAIRFLLFLAMFAAIVTSADTAVGDGKLRIFVADRDGSNVKLLVEIPGADYHGSPHWSADGKLILLNAMPGDRQYQLARIYACAVGGPFNGNVVDMGVGGYARFSPDMKRISFHVRAGNPDNLQPGIWTMRDDGTDRKRLCDGTRPRWTADGNSLVFVSPQGNSIEIVNADGTGQRLLLSKAAFPSVAGVAISPDGKHLCCIAYPQQVYDGVLYRVPIDDPAAEPTIVYRGKLGWDPAWSPDGQEILFWLLEENGDRHIVAVDADGKNPPRKLANQVGTRLNTDPEWSPDSRRILFSSDRDVPAQ
jgi:Tol biopolymer transport system component